MQQPGRDVRRPMVVARSSFSRMAVEPQLNRIVVSMCTALGKLRQEAQLMLTTGSTRLAVSRGQQTWYHSTCYI